MLISDERRSVYAKPPIFRTVMILTVCVEHTFQKKCYMAGLNIDTSHPETKHPASNARRPPLGRQKPANATRHTVCA